MHRSFIQEQLYSAAIEGPVFHKLLSRKPDLISLPTPTPSFSTNDDDDHDDIDDDNDANYDDDDWQLMFKEGSWHLAHQLRWNGTGQYPPPPLHCNPQDSAI